MDAQKQAVRLNGSMACPISPQVELAAVPACDRLRQRVEGKAEFGGFALQVLDFTRTELFLIAFGVGVLVGTFVSEHQVEDAGQLV